MSLSAGRFLVWASLCSALLALVGSTPARSAAGGAWAGAWRVGTVTMTVSQSGSHVTGLMRRGFQVGTTFYDMHCTGTASVGAGGVSTWRARCVAQGAGVSTSYVFTMAADGLSFTGIQPTYKGAVPLRFTRVGAAPAEPQEDTAAPTVRVVPPTGVHQPGTHVKVEVVLKDDSGRASLDAVLLDSGTRARAASGKSLSTKSPAIWDIPLGASLKGPLYVCAWAQDAAGNKSARAPRSSCAYVSLLVDIARVSNTCGGAGWDAVVKAENAFGNTSTYKDDASGASYTVNFANACNLHDAGYGGHTVRDTINGGIVDYHLYSRARVDEKFRLDMARQCRRQIPPSATSALSKCIRTDWRYATVRKFGGYFFDADLLTPGVQESGQRANH